MFSRLIDQFHKPAECSAACYETEKIIQELRALASSIENNECPDAIKARFCDKGKRTAGMMAYHAQGPYNEHKSKNEHPYSSKSSGLEKVGCDGTKRNGLQDECTKACCKARRLREKLALRKC